jgi:hypothetical protein
MPLHCFCRRDLSPSRPFYHDRHPSQAETLQAVDGAADGDVRAD